MILSLDLGTRTGYAYLLGDQVHSGTLDLRGGRYEGGGMRYLRFREWLRSFESFSPQRVVYEEVRRHAGTDAAHVYGGLLATLASWCEEGQIPYEGVPVGTIKKHITGKGNAGKEAVMAAVEGRGYKPADDNEADALALLLHAVERTTT